MIRALAFVALVAALVAAPAVARPSPADLESELVCPVCGTTLDQSDAPIAQRMKQYIRQRLAAGATEAQIKSELVDQFGPGVLAEPPKSGFNLLAWLVPLAVLVGGALGVGLVAWGWSRRRGDAEPAGARELDPELERRLDAELRRFEG
ncbi:cytochrome c-type biogenesis protein [Gaiella sp.]|uniref:cytochrome c-type biogenesis protein n=1 Tax=Gaiella sp. TaxID=2663207 RepID=UPI002E3156C6|nr:cytochrome c-type biogenesis protein [Gaiella sp.]HEX5585246.1 cytochrome c-type biogenesis protein [Gaiella sp.]